MSAGQTFGQHFKSRFIGEQNLEGLAFEARATAFHHGKIRLRVGLVGWKVFAHATHCMDASPPLAITETQRKIL